MLKSRVDQVFGHVVGCIESGQFAPGTRLPSVRDCAEFLSVSCETAVKAYGRLVKGGYVEARPRSGFYVTAQDNTVVANEGDGPVGTRSASDRATLEHLISCNLRDIAVRAKESEIMLTAGMADTLRVLVRSCMRAGEKVLVEDPGPIGQRSFLLAHGIQAIAVPRMHDGPDLEALSELCKRHAPRVFLCSTTLHDPTSSNCSVRKASQLLRLADDFDLTIIEDDSFGDLLPANDVQAARRLASLDGLERVIYVGGFEATLGHSLGVGFIAANRARIARLRSAVSIEFDLASRSAAEITRELLASGRYARHCDGIRARLELQRRQLAAELQAIGLRDIRVPTAGKYLWVPMGGTVDAKDVQRRVFDQAPALAPGRWFSDSAVYSDFVRIDAAIARHQPLRCVSKDHPDGAWSSEFPTLHGPPQQSSI